MIVNEDAEGHNCNECYVSFWKIQHLKDRMKEKNKISQKISQKDNFGKYKTQIT